jgi:DNA-directed RNA polymerase subunit RPC12/RpoP
MRINVNCWKCGTSNEVESETFLTGTIEVCNNPSCNASLGLTWKSIQEDLKSTSITCPHCGKIHTVNLIDVKTFDCPNCNNNIF